MKELNDTEPGGYGKPPGYGIDCAVRRVCPDVADNCNLNSSNVVAYVGGNYNQNRNGGLFYINSNNASNTNGNIGARLLTYYHR